MLERAISLRYTLIHIFFIFMKCDDNTIHNVNREYFLTLIGDLSIYTEQERDKTF